MSGPFLALVNPAAGGGRCGKQAGDVLEALRAGGALLQVQETRYPGHATELVREAYRSGYRNFLAVGGDGTSFEIVNGLFPGAELDDPPTLAFLPLGTGNSFLRDFTKQGPEYALAAFREGRRRPCDIFRLVHAEGVLHYINLLSMGFTADVASLTNRRFKSLGEFGYLLGVLVCLVRLRRRAFPLRINGEEKWDRRRCLFLTFNNSKFTGGKMMIAPQADSGDGLVEYVRWGPISRWGLVRNLHRLYDGSHVKHPLASRRGVRKIEFALDEPVEVMVDGEVLRLRCQTLDVLPAALSVVT